MRHNEAYIVVLWRGQWSRTIGPFYSRDKAFAFEAKVAKANPDIKANVEPLYTMQQFDTDQKLELT